MNGTVDGGQPAASAAMDMVFLSTSVPAAANAGIAGLLAALRDQGVAPAETITIEASPDPRARLAAALIGDPAAPPRAVALLDASICVSAPPLGAVLDDPRVRTGALAFTENDQGHRHLHLGVLKLDGTDRAVAAGLAGGLPVGSDDLLLVLTRALAAAGVAVTAVPLGGYSWARVGPPTTTTTTTTGSAAAVAERTAERTLRLRAAARAGDGFYSTVVLRKLSWRLTGLAERTRLSPNQVTLISFALGLLAAGLLALGGRGWALAGALLLQVCLVVDCVDGELARYRRRFSRFGAWLDATTDRVKEFAAVAALAAGAGAGADLWWLVAAAIAVQTFRNLLDLAWSLQRSGISRPMPADVWVAAPAGGLAPAPAPPGPGARSWLRRIGHFPIGERFLLISVGAALGTYRGTLAALLVAGLLSAGYMMAAFAVRSRPSSASGERIAGLADCGRLLEVVIRRLGGARAGRLSVLLPALVAVVELTAVWGLATGVAGARGSAAVALIAATAIAHYQHAYGVRENVVAVRDLLNGTDLRLLALIAVVVLPTALTPLGSGWATVTVWGLAVLVAAGSTRHSLRAWTAPRSGKRVAIDGTGKTARTAGTTNPAGLGKTGSADPKPPPAVLRLAIGGVR